MRIDYGVYGKFAETTINKEDLNYEAYQSDTDKLLDAARRMNPTSNLKNNLTRDREQELIKQQRDLIFRMRQVLWSVIQWNDEYKYLNDISGDPSWVQTAYDVFMDSRPK